MTDPSRAAAANPGRSDQTSDARPGKALTSAKHSRGCNDGRMKGRVLVVDDDTALAEMLTIVLRSEGFEPFVCGDGDKALAAFREFKPDLVLLDLMLPGRDGIDVCRALRAESGVPIVMLTALVTEVGVVSPVNRDGLLRVMQM